MSSTPSGPLQGAKSSLVNLYLFVYISLGGGGEGEWINPLSSSNLNPDFAKKDYATQHDGPYQFRIANKSQEIRQIMTPYHAIIGVMNLLSASGLNRIETKPN